MSNSTIDTQVKADTCNCPEPVQLISGSLLPESSHEEAIVSPNGEWLMYLEGNLMNLRTGAVRNIGFRSFLPANYQASLYRVVDWCKYDPSKVLITVRGSSDTNGSGQFVRDMRVYIFNFMTNEVRDVTPPQAKPFMKYFYASSPVQWLGTSQAGNDTLYFQQFEKELGRYHVQSQTMIPHPYEMRRGRSDSIYTRYAPNGLDAFVIHRNPSLPPAIIAINNQSLSIPSDFNIREIPDCSWSPDGKYFVIQAGDMIAANQRDSCRGYTELWLYDVEALKAGGSGAPLRRINLRKEYCMYSSYGTSVAFLSKNTMAVSMHKDGDRLQAIYEIDIDGKLLRQLTR